MEVHFIVNQENGKAKKFRLENDEYVVIGRSSQLCQVVLNDDLCSSKHCKISILNDCIIIEDLNSKNGVSFNGQPVLIKQRLFINDKVKLGAATVYINPSRMEKESIELCSYTGGTRGINSLILEKLDNQNAKKVKTSKESISPDKTFLTETVLDLSSQNQFKQNSRQSAVRIKTKKLEKKKKQFSEGEFQVRKLISHFFDFIFTAFCFIIFLELSIVLNPELRVLNSQMNYLKFLFQKETVIYTFASIAISILFYRLNRRLTSASLGERLLKLKNK